MSVLLLVLIGAALGAAFLAAPRDSSGKRMALSAYTLVLTLMVVYLVLPAILILVNDSRYLWAPTFAQDDSLPVTLALSLAAVLAFYIGHLLAARAKVRHAEKPKPRHQGARAPSVSIFTACVTVALGLALKIQFVLAGGGLDQTVQRLSGSVRSNSGLETLDGDALGLRNLSGIADGAAVWLLLQALKSKKHRTLACLTLIGVLILSYTIMGKRLGLLWPIIAIAVGVHVFVRKIPLKILPIGALAFLILTMGTLMFRIFLPAASAGVSIDLNQVSYSGGSLLAFYFYSLEFSTVEMLTVAIYGKEQVIQLFGDSTDTFFQTSIVPLSYVIPRSLWPEKPDNLYDLSHGISSVATGTPLQTTVGFAATLVGTSYITAGLLGTILTFLVIGFITAKIDRRFAEGRWNVEAVLSYSFVLVVIFHTFRQGTLGWVFIITIVQQIGFMIGILLPYFLGDLKKAEASSVKNVHSQSTKVG